MSPQVQTMAALAIVAAAAIWLILRALRRRRSGCGTDCGAISPEVRKLQAHMKRRS